MDRIRRLFEPTELTPRLRREADLEAFAILRRAVPPSSTMMLVCAVIAVALLAYSADVATLALWAFFLATPPLLQLSRWQRRRDRGRPRVISHWAKRRAVMIGLWSGAVWGFFGAVNIAKLGIGEQALVGFLIAGMSAGAMTLLHRVPPMASAFVLAATLPGIAALIAIGQPPHLFAAALSCVFVGFLLLALRVGYGSFLESVRLRIENMDLLHRTEAASRAKSAFLATMSHELRTPLNAVIGYAQLMQQGIHGPLGHGSYKEYVDHIFDSGEHLLNLINDILDLSKIEAGKYELNEACFALAPLIEQALTFVRPRAEKGGLRLVGPDPATALGVRADERALKQVLVNLLSNAVKFTPAGGTVSISARIKRSGELAVTVTDTGVGMTKEEMASAMRMFEQVGEAEHHTEGSGIGLPLSRSIAELHGGALELESAPQRGTTVRIILPAERVHEIPETASGVARAAAG